MSRYLFKFHKLGEMRFISHLDLQRLFKRAIRRAGIELVYSQGYNPHPKINIVQPLSLGFETKSDYFEFSTTENQNIPLMLSKYNEALPDGILFLQGKELPEAGKNLSSFVEYAQYDVFLPYQHIENAAKALEHFTLQNEIIVNKRSKKNKENVRMNVKHMVREICIHKTVESGLYLNMLLRSASNETLNPLIISEAFCESSSEPFEKEDCHVVRQDLFYIREGELISLFDYTST